MDIDEVGEVKMEAAEKPIPRSLVPELIRSGWDPKNLTLYRSSSAKNYGRWYIGVFPTRKFVAFEGDRIPDACLRSDTSNESAHNLNRAPDQIQVSINRIQESLNKITNMLNDLKLSSLQHDKIITEMNAVMCKQFSLTGEPSSQVGRFQFGGSPQVMTEANTNLLK
jgi:hypothetical protein